MDDIEIEEQRDNRQDLERQSTASSSLVVASGGVEEGRSASSSGLDLLAMVSTPSASSVVSTAHNVMRPSLSQPSPERETV
jgi:hypothetical protein